MVTAADTSRQPIGQTGAVLDACVLVPVSLRGVLLSAAERGAFAPVWSEPILGELRGVLLGKGMLGPDGEKQHKWERLDRTLRGAFPAALVPTTDIRRLEPAMRNDPKDRHVVAAAVASGSPVVVTNNLRDFRPSALGPVGVRAIHPDAYLVGLLDRAPELMRSALSSHVNDMRGPGRWTEAQVLGHLKGLGRGHAMAPRFAARAEAVFEIRAEPPPLARDGPRDGLSRKTGRTPPSSARVSPSAGLTRARAGREDRSI